MAKQLAVKVRNLSGFDLQRASMNLKSGAWSNGEDVPGESLPSGATETYSVVGTSELDGIDGEVEYEGAPGLFNFTFTLPFIGDNSFTCQVPAGCEFDIVGDQSANPTSLKLIFEPPE